ncbi:MAG: hypothetical protein LUG93_00350 [Lachnospiraceae bacterium]|nr:hypothetical protein [Lachnospiraceae bacterium]
MNPDACLSFCADFLYPLASASTLEQFYKEKPDEEKTASLVYEKNDTTITFGITGDAVSTVTIAAVTE